MGKGNKEQCQGWKKKERETGAEETSHTKEKHLETLAEETRAETDKYAESMGRGRRRQRIRCVGSAGDGGWFSASSGDDGRELPCRSGELQGQMKMIWDIDSPTQERTEFPMSSPWVFFFFAMISPGCILRPLRISFLSAEDNNACYGICDEEEPQEAPSSPPRCEPGKEGGLSALICRLSDVWIHNWTTWLWL